MGPSKWSVRLTITLLALTSCLTPYANSAPQLSSSQSSTGYVPAIGTHTVCLIGLPTCDYATIQDAVDASDSGDLIQVATGTYTDLSVRCAPPGYIGPAVITQVVYLSKTVTIRGGYTTDFADPPDPVANPTTMDAQGKGRVLVIVGTISPTIEGLRITGGDATDLGGNLWGGGDAGGGVYVISATATISSIEVSTNTAFSGGGLFLWSSTAMLYNNSIYANNGYNGGGLFLRHGDTLLSWNMITTNTANSGGGLYLEGSNATLKDNTIAANTAYAGGGVNVEGGYPTFNHNTITANTAYAPGGGLCVFASKINFSGNTITMNHTYGGGGGLYLAACEGILNGNTIASNTASAGGGLYLVASETHLSGNTIVHNTAYDDGGGLCLRGQSFDTINANTVVSNTARYGGGLFLNWSAPTLINTVVADNQASIAGSGFYIEKSSPSLLHMTIAHNSGGEGSGLYVTSAWSDHSSVALTNTILVDHKVGITVSAGSTVTLEATLWGSGTWANETDWGGNGTVITGTINLWEDPAFVAAREGDYHISATSGALDVGMDAGVRMDFDNQPRPYQNPDLGADEYWPPGVLESLFLPLIIRG